MRFKELKPDQLFVFASERDIPGYQGARGPWAKVDQRSYVRIDHTGRGVGICYRVGTINVEVYPD